MSLFKFVELCVSIHGEKFDYSKITKDHIINSNSIIPIICNKCKYEYETNINNHVNKKRGCIFCSGLMPYNLESFIQKAKYKHGDKYDYSNVVIDDVVNSKSKVKIICREHGLFMQTIDQHIRSNGCKKCSISKMNSKHTQEELNQLFIQKARLKHGDEYDYSKVIYKSTFEKIIIICKVHGEFLQKPTYHVSGSKCQKCSKHHTYTDKEWIEKSKLIHDNKYDYEEVNYISYNDEVKIICKIHGAFFIKPSIHIKGTGCKKCSGNYIPSNDEWIQKAKKVHGDKYDYSKTKYKNNKVKLVIICKIHGEFLQTPSLHLNGSGCSRCTSTYNCNTFEWIEKAKKVHGNKYDYSLSFYENRKSKVIIICKEHGNFEQIASVHIRGSGCLKCVGKYKPNFNEWIESCNLVHNKKYDYSESNYVSQGKLVTIICKIHGEFNQKAGVHQKGAGCPKCAKTYKLTLENFIEKSNLIHNGKYDYSNSIYISQKDPITIICKIHGEFSQQAGNHIRGSGCPKCSNHYTYTNQEWIEKAISVHGDKYDYSQTNYRGWGKKVTIICKTHGNFDQDPYCHINRMNGCSKCSKKYKPTSYEWIEKANVKHNFKYDYSKVNYISNQNKITIICKDHGEFYQRPKNHLMHGQGCPKCQLCPSCFLFGTHKNLCSYCKPFTENKLYQKTKEMKVVQFLRDNLPDQEFIHN